MLDARPILDRWLTNEQFDLFSQAVSKAYKLCDEFCRSNIVTELFLPGVEQRSNLLNAFVQYELRQVAEQQDGFFHEIKFNYAKNCRHIRLYRDELVITSHFLGRNNARGKAWYRDRSRPAKNRAVLASRNLDLFQDSDCEEVGGKYRYCQLLHSGFIRPDEICLALPTPDQSNISHSMALPIAEPKQTEPEQIREELILNLLSAQEEEYENEKTG